MCCSHSKEVNEQKKDIFLRLQLAIFTHGARSLLGSRQTKDLNLHFSLKEEEETDTARDEDSFVCRRQK